MTTEGILATVALVSVIGIILFLLRLIHRSEEGFVKLSWQVVRDSATGRKRRNGRLTVVAGDPEESEGEQKHQSESKE